MLRIFFICPDIVDTAVWRIFAVNQLQGVILCPFKKTGTLRVVFKHNVDAQRVIVAGPFFLITFLISIGNFPLPFNDRCFINIKNSCVNNTGSGIVRLGDKKAVFSFLLDSIGGMTRYLGESERLPIIQRIEVLAKTLPAHPGVKWRNNQESAYY